MKSIRKQRNGYALLFAASSCMAVWLGSTFIFVGAFAFGAVSAISLLFLVRQSRLLYDATLIWDNRILVVPSILISMEGAQEKNDKEETVISTFGMLIGSRIYRWGLNGVHGVRLNTARIDQERMCLTFGDAARTMRVEFLHGMTQRQAVLDAAQKLWYETGVTVNITDW